jgi:hypothetical protein
MDELSAREALSEIDRVDRQVRRSVRGVGWMFLIIGIATVPYWIVMLLGPESVFVIAAPAWVLLTVGTTVYWHRLRVHERRMKRINRWTTVAYVAATLLVCGVGLSLRFTDNIGPWAPLVVGLSVLAGAPPLAAGVLLLRAP